MRHVVHLFPTFRVLATKFTGDGKFIVSGSADMNLRVWKTNASEILGPVRTHIRRFVTVFFQTTRAEKETQAYRGKLKEKFGHMPEIQRIARHRHLPSYIRNQTQQRLIATTAETRKQKRRVANNPRLNKETPLKSSMIKSVEVEPEAKRLSHGEI